ncbi:restriction endonuclease subunit S [Pedobacter sp. GR22-6]|uniref:restriction endonuclease subunit S n=1 Tax=Pedobacter sp. GR22-6 TaxID=3127957 RepID=UPI00307E1DE2
MGKEDMKYKLPEGWVWTKLSEITLPIRKTNRNQENSDDEFQYIDIESIDNSSQSIKNFKLLTWGVAPSRAQQIVETNDILFSTVRPYLKNIALVTAGYNLQIASSGFCVLRVKGVNFKYVYYYVLSAEFISRINKLAKGTSYPAVTNQIVLDQNIPIPSLVEQDKIVSLLDELLSELENGKEQLSTSLKQLKVYRQSILRNAFEGVLTKEWRSSKQNISTTETFPKLSHETLFQLKRLPEPWVWTQLREISNNIEYGYTEKSTKEPIGPKFLRITDIQDNNVDWGSVPYCKVSDDKKGKYLLRSGDLVFARTGATVGKSYLIKTNPPEAVYASYLIRVRLMETFIPEYIYYFFQSEFYWRQITDGQVGIGQPNVNGTKLSELYVPITSIAEQEEIVKILGSVLSKCDNLENTIKDNTKLIENFKHITLNKAFEGKLTEQNLSNESATALLERTRIEREIYINGEQKKKNTTPAKIKMMAEELKDIIDILIATKKPVAAKELWQSSNLRDNIDDFYAQLKKHIEAGEIVEMPRNGKESFLKISEKK